MEQHWLFDQGQESPLTIQVAARSLLVSEASIRNWIRTGYLEQAGKNAITIDSFNNFRNQSVGKQKLTQRANKSLKDGHNHLKLEEKFHALSILEGGNGDSLSHLYESSLSESYKNKEGIFYTPIEVAKKFFEYLPEDCSKLTFCDPCCGTGSFLIAALERGFKPENIHGLDIDKTALEIARRRFRDRGAESEINLKVADFLEVVSNGGAASFDVVCTNPPWGKKLPKHVRDSLAKILGAGCSRDTSAIFFFACLMILKKSGYLGMLFQEAFFNVATFESARVKALELQIKSLIDFGKPFDGLLTKARGIVIQNKLAEELNTVFFQGVQSTNLIPQKSFRINPKSIITFNQSCDDSEVIKHLFSIEHITLKGNARYGLGIVTGNNSKFCSSEMLDDYIAVQKGADITASGIKPSSAFIPKDFSLYQQVAPLEMYQSNEKLIYKFISSELVFFHDTECRFMLNSANMLVLNESFPISHRQLCFLLNTRLMSWIFKKLFETHKILKSDIEVLPIYINYFNQIRDFSESSLLSFLSIEEVSNGTFRIKK